MNSKFPLYGFLRSSHAGLFFAGSGQSPNSTHPGSPPAITAPPPSLLSSKRPAPNYIQGNDGLPTKRQRISRCNKSEPISGSSSGAKNGRTAGSSGGSNSNSVSVPGGGAGGSSASGSGGGSGVVDGWDQRQHQRDRRGDYRPERTANSDVLRGGGGYGSSKPCLTPTSDSEEGSQAVGHRDGVIASASSGSNASVNAASSHNSHSSVAHSSSFAGNRHHTAGKSLVSLIGADDSTGNADHAPMRSSMPSVVTDGGSAGSYSGSSSSNGMLADRRDRSDRNDRGRGGDRDRDSKKRSNATSSNSYNDLVSSDFTGNEDNTVTTSTCNLDLPESPKSSEYPDYLT